MATTSVEPLIAQVKSNNDVVDSATAWINGSLARIQAAVDAALANGATSAELKPLTDEIALQTTKVAAVTQAIIDNTPAA